MVQELVNYLIQNLWLAALVAGLLLFVALLLVARAATRRLRAAARAASTVAGGLQLLLPGGAACELPGLPATLGRSAGSTIVVRDPAVSATHARIYFDELLQAICIEDCDSTNGVYVDGQPTRKNVLRDNARITIGATTLTFHDGGFFPPLPGGAAQGTTA